MSALDRGALRELAGLEMHPAVSVLLPTHRAGLEVRGDAIRLKSLLRAAHEELGRWGLEDALADRVLEPASALLDDRPFWREGAEGRAIFAAPNFFRVYTLHWTPREAMTVGERFQLTPLLPALAAAEPYHVLAISQHSMRLIAARGGALRELDLGDLPRRAEEALGSDTPEPQLQEHVVATTGRAGGDRAAAVHGQHPGLEGHKAQLHQLFSRVDQRVRELLPGEEPLVLAAVEYVASLYRQASTYPGLAAETLTGSPDDVESEELAARALMLLRPRLDRAGERARQRVEAGGSRLLARDLGTVLTAAADGRVSDLFVDPEAERWGHFDRGSSAVHAAPGPGPAADDLINLAVILTVQHAGAVHGAPREDIPGGGEIAAVLRYPSPESAP